MRKSGLATLIGGLLLATTAANAQELAAAATPKQDFVVFAEKGTTLSPTARETVARAATEANGSRLTLVGRAENIAPVKAELQRNGVPAERIVVRPEARAPIAKAADGLSNPVDRRVEIKF